MGRVGRALAVGAVAAGLVAAPASNASAANLAIAAKVRVVDDDFRPESVTVPVGATVGWINRGFDEHTVTFDNFDAVLNPGEKVRRRFRTAGTYEYFCRFHFGMAGEVVVTP